MSPREKLTLPNTPSAPAIVPAMRLATGTVRRYVVPSWKEAYRHSQDTYGNQYDPVERSKVVGGTPLLWPAVKETKA